MITALWLVVGILALFSIHVNDGPLLRTTSFIIFLIAAIGFWGNVFL